MDFTGKIIRVLPKRSGTSASGKEWSSQNYVIEDTSSRYPRHMFFSVFGEENINNFSIKEGDYIQVLFDIDAHEYKGNWYNNINAYKVNKYSSQSASLQSPQTPSGKDGQSPFESPKGELSCENDLPF